MARNKLGPIPDDHFENDALPHKEIAPLSQYWLDFIEKHKAERDKN